MLRPEVDRSHEKYDLVFDVTCPKVNRNPHFVPVQGNLKGDEDIRKIHSDRPPGYLNQVGGWIPGYQLQIDTANKTARVVDRLKQVEHADLWEKCKKIHAIGHARVVIGDNWRRDPDDNVIDEGEFSFDSEAPNNLATWLWWCRLLVDRGRLSLVKGDLPEADEIRRIGDIYMGDNFGMSPKDGKRDFNYLYADEAPKAAKKPVKV